MSSCKKTKTFYKHFIITAFNSNRYQVTAEESLNGFESISSSAMAISQTTVVCVVCTLRFVLLVLEFMFSLF